MDVGVITIRIARIEDAGQICALVNSAYRGEVSKQGWTTEADFLDGQRTDEEALAETLSVPGNAFLLLLQDESLLGSVHLQKKEGYAYLGMLTIKPDQQGAGHGKQLLAEAENWVRDEWGLTKIRMNVIQKRWELIAWYERRDYRVTSERSPFPYGNPRLGIPKVTDLEFLVLEKALPHLPDSSQSR